MFMDLRTLSLPVGRNSELCCKIYMLASIIFYAAEFAEGIIVGRRLQVKDMDMDMDCPECHTSGSETDRRTERTIRIEEFTLPFGLEFN